MRIGIISDTHGTIPQQVYSFFGECDEIWHAGDLGQGVYEKLSGFKPLVAVYGNTDGWDLRNILQETRLFRRQVTTKNGENKEYKIILTHIGGYPGRYERRLLPLFQSEKPDIFVCGHSHILRVMFDNTYNLLHINPGAAGRQGIHQVATLVRLTLDDTPKDLEYIEFPKY